MNTRLASNLRHVFAVFLLSACGPGPLLAVGVGVAALSGAGSDETPQVAALPTVTFEGTVAEQVTAPPLRTSAAATTVLPLVAGDAFTGLDLEPIQARPLGAGVTVRIKVGDIVLGSAPIGEGGRFTLKIPLANLPEGSRPTFEIATEGNEPSRIPLPLSGFAAGERAVLNAVLRAAEDAGTGKRTRKAVVNAFRDNDGNGASDNGVLLTIDDGVVDVDQDGQLDPVVRQTTADGLMLFDADGDGEFGEAGAGDDGADGDDAVDIAPHPSSGRTRRIAGAVDVVAEDPAARAFPGGRTVQDTIASLAVHGPALALADGRFAGMVVVTAAPDKSLGSPYGAAIELTATAGSFGDAGELTLAVALDDAIRPDGRVVAMVPWRAPDAPQSVTITATVQGRPLGASFTVLVLEPEPVLVVEDLALPRSTVSLGQKDLSVLVKVRNDGDRRVTLTRAELLAVAGGGAQGPAQDRTREYRITADKANATSIDPGRRATLAYTVEVRTSATATRADDPATAGIDESASGTVRWRASLGGTLDGGAPTAASGPSAGPPPAWELQRPARLVVTGFAVPARIKRSETAAVTLTVTNTGGAAATVSGGTLAVPPGVGLSASFAAGNPSLVAGGSTAAFVIDLAAIGTAAAGTRSLTATLAATDANSGHPASAASNSASTRLVLPPAVTVTTPPGAPAGGPIEVGYTLADTEGDVSQVRVQWRTAGGSFLPATITAGPGTIDANTILGLATTPAPASYAFTWDTRADLGPTRGTITLRLIPADATESGTPASTDPFVVDNNDAPDVRAVAGPAAEVRGLVALSYALFDTHDDPASIAVQYSYATPSGRTDWRPATMALGGISGLATYHEEAGFAHIFVWDSATDLGPRRVKDATLRVQASDGKTGEWSAPTAAFAVDNNEGPVAAATTPAGADLGPPVVLRYTLADGDADYPAVGGNQSAASIDVEYSLDGGGEWRFATSTPGHPDPPDEGLWNLAASPDGTPHVFVWNWVEDVGHTRNTNIRLRVTPVDLALGEAAETDLFTVDNNEPPAATVDAPPSGQRVNPEIPITVADSDLTSGHAVSVEAQYRVDGTTDWLPATLLDDGSDGLADPVRTDRRTGLSTTEDGARHTLHWDRLADIRGGARVVQLRVRPTDPFGAGDWSDPSPSFPVGNDAPSASLLPIAGVQAGNVIVKFRLTDSTADPADINSVRFRLREAGAADFGDWSGATFEGNRELLATTLPADGGVEHLIVWKSREDIDKVIGTVELELRPIDAANDSSDTKNKLGAPATVQFELDNVNNTAPVVTVDNIGLVDEQLGAVVPIYVTIADAETDDVDLAIEFIDGTGATPLAATEYPTRLGEGAAGLVADADGIGHIFYWNAAADLPSPPQHTGVRLRVTPTDARGLLGQAVLTPVDLTMPVPGGLREQLTLAAGTWPHAVAMGDVNGDDLADAVVANRDSNDVGLYLAKADGSGLAEAVMLAAGTTPVAIAMGDVNGDGKADAVVVNQGSNDICVYLAKSDGTGLNAAATLAAGTTPIALALGDINGDGKLDAVVVNQGSNDLCYYLAKSDGTGLDAAVTRTAGTAPIAVALGDVNGDGKLDAVAANQDSDDISFYLAKSDGTGLNTAVTLAAGTEPFSVAMGDINDDGKADVVVSNKTSVDLYQYLARADGSGLEDGLVLAPSKSALGSVALGDVNGDGKNDAVVLASSGAGAATLYLAKSDGTGLADYVVFASRLEPYAQALGDINGDGRVDAVMANRASASVSLFLGKADGFVRGDAVTIDAGASPSAVALGDVNGDGLPDVVVPNALSNDISLYFAGADNTGLADASLVRANSGSNTIVVGDVNGDGRADLVHPTRGSGPGDEQLVLYLAGADGSGPGPATNLPFGDRASVLAAADVNGDGLDDVVAVRQNFDELGLYLARDDGAGLEEQFVLAAGMQPHYVALGDVSGDGRADAVVANNASAELSLLLSRADGTGLAGAASLTTEAAPNLPGSQNSKPVALGDVNGDGLDDAVLANISSASISLFLAAADGTGLAGRTTLAAGSWPWAVALGDVNGDGLDDTVVANRYGNSISLYLARADGSGLAEAIPYTAGALPQDIELADLNGDGRADAVVSNGWSDSLSLFLARSDGGGFTDARTLAAGDYAQDVALGDVNSDGLADAVVVNTTSDNASLFLAKPDGTGLSGAIPLITGTSPIHLVMGDVTGDGRADVAVRNPSDDTLSVFHQSNLLAPQAVATVEPAAETVLERGPARLLLPSGYRLAIPAGAVAEATPVTMAFAEPPASMPAHLRAVSRGVLLLRETLEFGNPAALPALTIPFNPAVLDAEIAAAATAGRIRLYRFGQAPARNPANFDRREEVSLGAEAIDIGARTVTASIDRFGLYVVTIDKLRLGARVPARSARKVQLGKTAIPDASATGGDTGLTKGLWVGDDRTIGAAADLEVLVNIAHPKRGDLKLTLTHPDGTSVVLRNADAGDATANHFVEYSHLTDTAIKVAPADAFGALAGKSAQGMWTLQVEDTAAGNTGDLLYWRITVR